MVALVTIKYLTLDLFSTADGLLWSQVVTGASSVTTFTFLGVWKTIGDQHAACSRLCSWQTDQQHKQMISSPLFASQTTLKLNEPSQEPNWMNSSLHAQLLLQMLHFMNLKEWIPFCSHWLNPRKHISVSWNNLLMFVFVFSWTKKILLWPLKDDIICIYIFGCLNVPPAAPPHLCSPFCPGWPLN